MKVLFQPVYMETPHFETELELMADHLDAGDDVYVLTCHGELGTCFANYEHEPSICRTCQSRCATGLGLLDRRVNVVGYPFPPPSHSAEIPERIADFEALKAFQIGKAQIGMGAASSLVTRFQGEHRFDTSRYRREIVVELATAYYVYKAVRQVLLEVQPDRVYLFNGRFSTVLPALNACEELGVPYATHERGGTLDRYLMVPDTVPHDIGRVAREIQHCWPRHSEAESMRRGARFFVDRRNRVEHSWYSYTTAQEVGALPDGFDQSKKNVAIFNSSLEEGAAIRCWPNPFRVYAGEIEALDRISSAFRDDDGYHLYLRLHPQLKGLDITQTRELRALEGRLTNLTMIAPESGVDSYALMEQCASVLTFGSTMGVEACFWGKPSILLGRAFYEDLDCAYAPSTHDEVVALLRSDLRPKPLVGALKYGLWELTFGQPFKRYKPENLTRGTFAGVRINDPS